MGNGSHYDVSGRQSDRAVWMEGGLCLALSALLGELTLFRMPQGGSVNLELFPLILFVWRRGGVCGLYVGFCAGMLFQFLADGIVHPLQAVLDYPMSYAAVSLVTLWPEWKPLSLIPMGLWQWGCHVLSDVLFFAGHTPAGQNPWVCSMIYNSTYLAPKVLLGGLAAWIALPLLNRCFPVRTS